MKNKSHSFYSAACAGAGFIFALLALSGCKSIEDPPDLSEAHKIKVRQEMRFLTIETAAENRNLVAFVDDYLSRGSGALMVNLSSDGKESDASKAKTDRITKMLLKAGLRSSEVIFIHKETEPANGDAVKISFQANLVEAPECGKWSSRSSLNWKNKNHGNFGCSYKRNIGVMVENPRDLETPRNMSDRAAPHSLHIVNVYEPAAGTPSGDRGVGSVGLRSTEGSGSAEGAATSATSTATEATTSGQ